MSRCSRSFERLAEVQARADEEELRARREATKASEAAAAAKRLEAELQQLRGIGSQAQPHHSLPPASLPPALPYPCASLALAPSTVLVPTHPLPLRPPSAPSTPSSPPPSAQRERLQLQGELNEAARAHRALEEARASHGSEAERWAARERHLQAEREQMQQDLALSQARAGPSDSMGRVGSGGQGGGTAPRPPCPRHFPPRPPTPPPRHAVPPAPPPLLLWQARIFELQQHDVQQHAFEERERLRTQLHDAQRERELERQARAQAQATADQLQTQLQTQAILHSRSAVGERRARSPVHAAAAADALGGAWRSRIAQSERDSQLAFSVDLMNFARHVGP